MQAEIALDEPDIICLTEVKPKNGTIPEENLLNIDGYDHFLNPAYKDTDNRGVCIYTKQYLNASAVIDETTKSFKDSTWVTISGRNNKKLLMSTVYRSGTPEKAKQLDSDLHKTMKEMSLNKDYSQIVIAGDFNHPNIKWTESVIDGESLVTPELQHHHNPDHCDVTFLDCIGDSLLLQHVTQPTRYRDDQNPTLDDLIFTSDDQTVSNIQYKHHLGNSDHLMLTFNTNFCFDKPKVIKKHKLNYNKINVEKMHTMLNLDWDTELQDKDPEEAYNIFLAHYNQAVEESVPKSVTTVSNKYHKPLWMRFETLKLIKKKHHTHDRYLNTKNDGDKERYKAIRNKVTHQIKEDRMNFEHKLAREVKENSRVFWKYVNSSKKTRGCIPHLKRTDGTFTSSDQQKADALNKQFASVFTTEDDHLPQSEELNLEYLLENITVTENQVKEKLMKLRADKAPGPDSVHPLILKKFANQLCKPLAKIYNLSFSSQILPSLWKIGNISAIFKKGDKTLPQNYRPVQLTSIVSKIIESIITDAILHHLVLNNLEDLRQHGFTRGKSTVTNLLQALNVWSEALSHGIPVDVIYLDFEKAFDKVPHRRLLQELHRQGIRGQMLGWITQFLKDRKQRVRINDEYSEYTTVLSGVPQGSVLGPTLFLLYVSQISSLIKNFTSLFADDTKIFSYLLRLHENLPEAADVHLHTTTSLQEDLNSITEWSEKFQMSFNLSKCHILHLGHKNPNATYTMYKQHNIHKTKNCISYLLQFHTLDAVEEEVDLGITVDNKLKFTKHVNTKISKANKILGLIKHTFKFLTADTLTLLYKSLIRPHVEYGTPIWSPHLKGDRDNIEKLQRRTTKLIPDLKDKSYEERLRHLKLPTLEYRRLRTDLILLYKYTHNLIKLDTNSQIA